MADISADLKEKKAKLAQLLDNKSKATCDTRNLSAADIQREEEIEDLEEEIAKLEKKPKAE
jgi:hypothetical protein